MVPFPPEMFAFSSRFNGASPTRENLLALLCTDEITGY